jgi:hypothetical protein
MPPICLISPSRANNQGLQEVYRSNYGILYQGDSSKLPLLMSDISRTILIVSSTLSLKSFPVATKLALIEFLRNRILLLSVLVYF